MSFFGNRKLIIVLIGLVLLLVVMGSTARDRLNLTWPEKFLKDTASVVQEIFYRPAQAVSTFFHEVQDVFNAYEENRVLKSSLDQYTQMAAELKAVKAENKKLLENLQVKQDMNDYNLIYSQVVARNTSQWNDVLVIGNGSKNGVKKDMAVITSQGLVGRVESVSNFSSTVELLTSLETSAKNRVSSYIITTVPVQPPAGTQPGNTQQGAGNQNTANQGTTNQNVGNQDQQAVGQNNTTVPTPVKTENGWAPGILEGYDSTAKLLIMRKIPLEHKIKVGDPVITSGLGGTIPSKLPVGIVERIEPGDYGLTQTAYIKPYADFSLINDVFIVNRDFITTPSGEVIPSNAAEQQTKSADKGGDK
ncbi:rod shape-determining protein MreC [Brevibacillus daliensis]|uniref:rod shape-determining protein MreC n=1 Tax=Brevibacillus daliensis TaxID=2892995 RepID=UPI001E5B6BE0|nr:rod shape-determining protein MreC [Brevibacillus daliensis]